MKDAKGHGSNSQLSDQAAAATLAQGHSKSLAVGLHTNWRDAPNPYTAGGFAAQSRYRRNERAADYVEQRAGRSSNFKFG